MIAQFILSILLAGFLVYAWSEYARSPAIAVLAVFVTMAGLYFVWMPEHSTQLAELVGIGRGVDLILYIWVCLSLIVVLNLHLKLRTQMELITVLARRIAPTRRGSLRAAMTPFFPAQAETPLTAKTRIPGPLSSFLPRADQAKGSDTRR